MNKLTIMFLGLIACVQLGCTTATRQYAQGETRKTVAGYSESNIQLAISRAVQSILSQNRICLHSDSNRAIMIVEKIKDDTTSRGYNATPLATTLGQCLRKELTNSGRVVVFNKEAAKYAKVKLEPQYHLSGVLTERRLQDDDGDYQRDYNLCLTLIDLNTGTEFWQENINIGKYIREKNINK